MTAAEAGRAAASPYNFAYLDEQTKRMIRRAILKAIAVPGYQVPFASREMPMPYGWGTGGVQVTASILGPDDVLKVIDQGADDTTNAVSIRRFFAKTAGVATTTATRDATVIQTRHRIPEAPLAAGQILVYQVPIPEPLRFLEPRETETRRMHALEEYGLMHVKLYEDIAKHGAHRHHLRLPGEGRRPLRDGPLADAEVRQSEAGHRSPALQLFGAGREKRIYAIPPLHRRGQLDFEDHPFERDAVRRPVRLCGATGVYLDEIILDDSGGRMFVCSDTDYCESGAPTAITARCTASRRDRRCGSASHEPLARAAALGAQGLTQLLRRPDRLRRCRSRPQSGRGARGRRRVRVGQVDAADRCCRPSCRRPAASSAIACATAQMRDLFEPQRRRAPLLMRTDWGFVAPGCARAACA